MASSNRRDLYLQVSANVDALKANLKDGRSALVQFAGDATAQLEAVQKAIQEGLSGDGAANAAKVLTDSYSKAFSAIKANAQAVLSSGSNAGAIGVLNVQAAQKATQAAETQAAMIRQLATAAVTAAEAQGNENQSLVAYAAAALTAAEDAERYATSLRDQQAALEAVQGELATTVTPLSAVATQTAASRQGVLVLGEQFRQFGTEIALGISPAQAFAQQIGQVGFALTLFEGSLGGIGAFLAGPWGIALTVGLSVLAPFVAKLFEAGDAAKEAKLGSDGLADAQGVLGKMFDLASGKLERQNELLRLNAELTAINLRAQAAQDRQTAIDTSHRAVSVGFGDRLHGVLDRGIIEGWSGSDLGNRNRANVANIIDSVHNGSMSRETALRLSATQDFTGLHVTRDQFQQAIIDSAEAPLKDKIADDIEKALKTGILPQEVREDTKPRKPKVDHSAERAAGLDRQYQSQLDQAQGRIARAQLALADTNEGELKVKLDELDAAQKQRDLELDDEVAQKRLTPAQAGILKTKEAQATALEKQKATIDKQQKDLDDALALDQQEIQSKVSLLQLQEDLATTNAQRKKIALQILDLEEKAARDAANRDIASTDPRRQASGRQALKDIDAQHDARTKQIDQQNAGPIDQFRQHLHQDTDDMNAALQSVATDGLQSLEDGLLGIIDGTESAASAFKKMATSIVSDLARIVIERAILSAIDGGSLFGIHFADGGEVESHAAGGLLSGPGSGTSDSIIARVSNGEYIINADSTRRWLPLLEAVNNGQMPGFADGGLIGVPNNIAYPRLPDLATLRAGGHGQQVQLEAKVQVDASPLLDARMQDISVRTVGAAAEPIMAGAQTRTITRLNRPRLPGGWG